MNSFSPTKNAFSCFFRRIKLCRLLASFLVFLVGIFQPGAVFAQDTLLSQGIFSSGESATTSSSSVQPPSSDTTEGRQDASRPSIQSYSQLISEFIALQDGRDTFGTLSDSDSESRRVRLLKQYEEYLDSERTRLQSLGIHPGKQKAHLNLLEGQIRALGGAPTFFDKVRGFVVEKILRREQGGIAQIFVSKEDEKQPAPLEHPSSFSSPEGPVILKEAGSLVGIPQPGQEIPASIKEILSLEEVQAGSSQAPVLDDTRADDAEVMITEDIRALALSLNNNPAEIFNYLSNTILFEPYAGAAKGSVGCLKEKACNDIDSASLTIALLRASGIPARYVKGLAIFTPSQITELLAVQDLKSALSLLGAGGKGYLFALSEKLPDGSTKSVEGNLQDLDLSAVSSVAIEWVYPQGYIDYGERGGNLPNMVDAAGATTDADLQTLMDRVPSRQWIPFDVIAKPHTHTQKDILGDAAGVDAETFWKNYLSSASSQSPVAAFASEVKNKTGKDMLDPSNRSTRAPRQRTLPVVPSVTPYVLAAGSIGTVQITSEQWSRLPDDRRIGVTISLHKTSDGSGIFEKQWFASTINNKELTLSYQGATDQDKATITEYDGIAHAPPSLVSVVPALALGDVSDTGSLGVPVGTSLILRFSVARGATKVDASEKYSTAGNIEGIYSAFSRIQSDPITQSPDSIVVKGPAAIARAYLDRIFFDADAFSGSLDYRYAPLFARAVVTDNRVIKRQDGVPISFEFSGLTMDATLTISGASGRGAPNQHRKDFNLIGAGLNPSYYESQIFADLAGLDGISTVTGLQFASSRPSEYTVKTITAANISEIDSLVLPTKTLQSMREQVGKGDTIVTPTTPLTKDAWSGIVYIALRPDFTATYAIGEQTLSNGGRSTDSFRSATYKDETRGKTKKTNPVTKTHKPKGR